MRPSGQLDWPCQCMPTHALTFTKHRQPMFNYYISAHGYVPKGMYVLMVIDMASLWVVAYHLKFVSIRDHYYILHTCIHVWR